MTSFYSVKAVSEMQQVFNKEQRNTRKSMLLRHSLSIILARCLSHGTKRQTIKKKKCYSVAPHVGKQCFPLKWLFCTLKTTWRSAAKTIHCLASTLGGRLSGIYNYLLHLWERRDVIKKESALSSPPKKREKEKQGASLCLVELSPGAVGGRKPSAGFPFAFLAALFVQPIQALTGCLLQFMLTVWVFSAFSAFGELRLPLWVAAGTSGSCAGGLCWLEAGGWLSIVRVHRRPLCTCTRCFKQQLCSISAGTGEVDLPASANAR